MVNILEQLLKNAPNNGKFYTVAIDGRGGSGKTKLAEYIAGMLPDFIILNGDDYFEPVDDGIAWGYFNDRRFIKDVIKPLQTSNQFKYRPYDWHTEPHISERDIRVEKGILLERGYSFSFDLPWDLKVWVETPRSTCFERGVARDHMPENREIKAWQVWQSVEDKYIASTHPKKSADLVIDGTKPFEKQLA